jgi:hypothetical protein
LAARARARSHARRARPRGSRADQCGPRPRSSPMWGATFSSYDASLHRDPRRAPRRDTGGRDDACAARRLSEPGIREALLAEVERDRPGRCSWSIRCCLFAAAAAESTGLPTAILWHTVYGGSAGRAMPSALLDR